MNSLKIECRWRRGPRIKPAKVTEKKQPTKKKSRRGWDPTAKEEQGAGRARQRSSY